MTKKALFFFFLCLLGGVFGHAQKVGVVLSGGGASGLAHIGFLRALEEQEIPIDYITGTSMGAIIGAMYASGYTVDEIDSLARTQQFMDMVQGTLTLDQQYFYKEPNLDASMARIKISKDGLANSLPTNLIDPTLLDFKLMELFSPASAAAGYDFDSLFVPFRCVAADIVSKDDVVFDKGHLNLATRASATYPFYLQPLTVDGKLLFDGGLYNNFPGNVMYQSFMPDVILGCNVSSVTDAPSSDNLVSQLKTMILARSDYDSLCTEMIVINPDLEIGTFDFRRAPEAVSNGYQSTMKRMEEVTTMIQRRVRKGQRDEKRNAFRASWLPLKFGTVTSTGLTKRKQGYLRNFIAKSDSVLSLEYIEQRYFQLFADPNIKSVFPLANYNPDTGLYDLELLIKQERDITARFGGNFSSRSINTGYVGLTYNFLGNNSTQINADSYFGKFYGSIKLGVKKDIQTRIPFSTEFRGGLQRWDYFTNFATFFEPVRPSFIVQNEQYLGVDALFPVKQKGRIQASFDGFRLEDRYYQTNNFNPLDTADDTRLEGITAALKYERSTLNRKQYASSGTYLSISGRWINAKERTLPGSTQENRDTIRVDREWFVLKLQYQNFFQKLWALNVGFKLDAVYSTQPLLSNYRATLLRAPAYAPIPEASTFFLDQYRNTAYTAAGLILVGNITKNIEIRPEAYLYVTPFGEINPDEGFVPELVTDFQPLFIGSASAIYHSPLGPISVSVNYYDQKQEPWSFLFNFGYLINHRRVLD